MNHRWFRIDGTWSDFAYGLRLLFAIYKMFISFIFSFCLVLNHQTQL